MKSFRNIRGFLGGVMVGVMVASVGVALAGIPKNVWDQNGKDFQLGYIIGFYDSAAMARNKDPGGFFDNVYPTFVDLGWYAYAAKIDEVWGYPENKGADGARAVALSAIQLKKDGSKTQDHMQRFKGFYDKRGGLVPKPEAAEPAEAAPAGDLAAPTELAVTETAKSKSQADTQPKTVDAEKDLKDSKASMEAPILP
ncbi:MAG: hypothetical protein ACI8TX_002115 [Hyphomicrobiaceae bacterium]|jgi:hypothetical protein